MSVNTDKLYGVAMIGYGPLGETAANLLGRDGFETIVIEKEAEVFDKPRVITFDQEVMRIIQSAGLALEILPCTTRYRPAIYLGMNGQIIRRFDPSPEPFPLLLASKPPI